MVNTLVNAMETIRNLMRIHNLYVETVNLPARRFTRQQVQLLFKAALTDSVDSRCYWASKRQDLDHLLDEYFPELEMLSNCENHLRDQYLNTVLDILYIDVEKVADHLLPENTWKIVELIHMGDAYGVIIGEDYRIAEYHRIHGDYGR